MGAEVKIYTTIILILFSFQVVGQKVSLKQKALNEIDCYIKHAYELLGKTDSAILAGGRPDSIIGGDKWDVEIINASKKKNSLKASKAIVIGTGCGALLLTVSEKTNLTSTLTFLPHQKTYLDGDDILTFLKHQYTFDKSAVSIIQTGNSNFIALNIMRGGILILAWDKDTGKSKFNE